MDISELTKHKELIAEKVHDAWWREKEKQGFHAPASCNSPEAKKAMLHETKSQDFYKKPKFTKYCKGCHTDMYPYAELPENIKDYDRVTVEGVLSAISEI